MKFRSFPRRRKSYFNHFRSDKYRDKLRQKSYFISNVWRINLTPIRHCELLHSIRNDDS